MVEQIIRTDAEGTPIEWRAGKRHLSQENVAFAAVGDLAR
jgi:hypothetical protein